jgi:hypothetical protein
MRGEKSFQLIRTNPLLTTNIKVVIDPEYSIYLESYSVNRQLSALKYKHFPIAKDSLYDEMLTKFYDDLPLNLAFEVENEADANTVFNTYENQYDDTYFAGGANIEDQWYKQEFEYTAPLYINSNKLPDNFLILRVDEPAVFNANTGYRLEELTKDNFRQEIVDKWKAVQLFDMTYQTDFGFWLTENFLEYDLYPQEAFEITEYDYPKWYGIDYEVGVYTSKSDLAAEKFYYEQPHFRLEQWLTQGYRSNGLVYPHIINFKYIFDDTPANPFELKKYSLNRYYGFYIEEKDLITRLTSYIPPTLKTDLKLQNNIFMTSSQTTGSTYPFATEIWDDTKTYYIYGKNDLFKVERNLEDGEMYYKIIATENLTINDLRRDKLVTIKFQNTGNTAYEVLIQGTETDLEIDPYYNKSGEVEGLFGDLYLMEIDGKYHVLKYRDTYETINYVSGGTVFSGQTAVNDVALDLKYSYLGTANGVFAYDRSGVLVWSADTSNSSLPANNIQSLSLSANKLVAGTAQGIWFKDLILETETIINSGNSNLPHNDVDVVHLEENLLCAGMNTTNQIWVNNINFYSGLTDTLNYDIQDFAVAGDLYVVYGESSQIYSIRRYFNYVTSNYVEYNNTNTPTLSNRINVISVENEVIIAGTDNGIWVKSSSFEKLYNDSNGFDLGDNIIRDLQVVGSKIYAVNNTNNNTNGIYTLDYLTLANEAYPTSSYNFVANLAKIAVVEDEALVGSVNGYELFNFPVNSATTLKFEFYLNTDWAIQTKANSLEYWIESQNSEYYVQKDIQNGRYKPLVFPVYRLRFCELKDFDFDRLDTGFADFDYEQTEYVDTEEQKLYAIEYRDTLTPKNYKTMPEGVPSQFKIMNVASEYTSGDELWEINRARKELTSLWRKNQTIVKWSFNDSLSHSDYPYKLNNNREIGGNWNRIVDIYDTSASIFDKNLDYMYRIGELVVNSGGTAQHFLQQSTNIETSLMESDSQKFNLELYLEADFDYFAYFFNNYMYYQDNNLLYQKGTKKYSYFNSKNFTLFKGLNLELVKVANLNYEGSKIAQIVRDNTGNYENYKCSIIYNPVYDYIQNKVRLERYEIQGLAWYNPRYLLANDLFGESLGVRGWNITETSGITITESNYDSLYYTLEETTTVAQVWQDYTAVEALALKNNGQLYLRITGNTSLATLSGYNFYEVSTEEELVQFIGTASDYYGNLSGSSVFLYDIVASAQTLFLALTQWDETEFLSNYSAWTMAANLFEVETLYGTNGGVLDSKGYLANQKNKIDLFLNEKYRNLLIVVNHRFNIETIDFSLNNIQKFGHNQGFYYGTYVDGSNWFSGINCNYDLLNSGIPGFGATGKTFEFVKINTFENSGYTTSFQIQDEKILNLTLSATTITYSPSQPEFKIQIYQNQDLLFTSDYFPLDVNDSTTIPHLYQTSLELTSSGETQVVFWVKSNNYSGGAGGKLNLLITKGRPYDPNTIIANHFVSALNNPNDLIGFEDYLTYHQVASDGTYTKYQLGTVGVEPPYLVNVLPPKELTLKINSYEVQALRGPKYNLYDKYKPRGKKAHKKYNIREPLARYIFKNEKDIPRRPQRYGETNLYNKTIYRYNGFYDVLFKDIELFNQKDYTYLDSELVLYESGYRFEDSVYQKFGEIKELLYSKVNPEESPLKLKNAAGDVSMYPMVDEFGYSWRPWFVFKSPWDRAFFLKTENEIE